MAKKTKPCKDCKDKKYDIGPLVIVAPQWVIGSPVFREWVQETRENGGYVDVLITGVPTGCIPTPNRPCK